jgi:acyl-CoA synthetase (AMP-forming)/AMP-acid ligase II
MNPMFGELRHFGDLLTRNAHLYRDRPGFAQPAGEGDPEIELDPAERTWGTIDARVRRLARALRRRGLRQGDRVAILGDNSAAWVEAFFALARCGMVAVPIGTGLSGGEVAGILEDCGATGLWVDDERLELARGAAGGAPDLHFVGGLGRAGGDVASLPELLTEGEGAGAELERPVADDDLCLLLYTSGTTGFPKGVMYTHRRMLVGTLIHVLAIGSAHRHRVLLPAPLYSAAGVAGIACAVAVGSVTRILRFDVDRLLTALESERITFTNLVPTTLRMMLDHPRFEATDLSRLELLLYGGSPMPEPLLRAASARLSCGFRQTFATSETGLSGTVLEPQEHRLALDDPTRAHLLLSCGRPQVGVGVRLLDDEGREVPEGEIGEVSVACEGNMVGYWNRPEATAEVLRDGWVRTGDLARRDADGYFYLVDRKHDMIVSGAFNVYPSEVERCLVSHPGVADCAVVGVPDTKWGEAVKAFVVRAADTTPEAVDEAGLIAWSRRRLAGHKRPKSIDFVDEIPRNPAGKPLRRVLRRPYWQTAEREIG